MNENVGRGTDLDFIDIYPTLLFAKIGTARPEGACAAGGDNERVS